MDYCVVAFQSSQGAICAQETLKKAGLPFLVIPVLREISLGCGIALRCPPEAAEPVRACLRSSQLREGEYAFFAVSGRGSSLAAAPLPETQR